MTGDSGALSAASAVSLERRGPQSQPGGGPEGQVDSPARPPRSRGRSFARGGALQAVVLLLGSTGVSLLFWPGNMDADALRQMGEASTGKFVDWWAPILDWFWRPLFLLHLSPGFVLWVTITIFFFSVYELLRLVLGRWPAVGVTFLVAVFPPVLGYLGALSRDAWFGTATLACYALLARGQRTRGGQSVACVIGSFIAAWIALAARQNAIPALLPAFFIATAMLLRPFVQPGRKAVRRIYENRIARFFGRVVLPLLLLFLFVVSQRLITYDVIHATPSYPQQLLYDFDLASLSIRTDHMLLPRSSFPSQSMAVLRAHYNPYIVTPLPLVGTTNPKVESRLQSAWIHAILSHPIAYLQARWEVWTRQIAWSGPADEPYHNGIDANGWGFKATFPSLNRFTLSYLSSFTSGPPLYEGGELYRVWGYLVACAIVGIDLLRRRRPPELRIMGWLCWAAVIYFLPFSVISMGPPFRWAWFLVVTTVLAVCVDVVAHVRAAVERRARAIARSFAGPEALSEPAVGA